jgi:hypothetical protein
MNEGGLHVARDKNINGILPLCALHPRKKLTPAPSILTAWKAAWILFSGFVQRLVDFACIRNIPAKQFGNILQAKPHEILSMDHFHPDEKYISHEINAPLTKTFRETDILKR